MQPVPLDAGWAAATSACAAALLAYAAAGAPWRSWLGRPDRQHAWLGMVVLALGVWAMQAGLTPGLEFHFLLATALTLMHGWRLALVGLGIVVTVLAVLEPATRSWWGVYVLAEGAVPVLFIEALRRAVERRLPHNYYVYFFVTVFAGTILAFNLAGAARLGLLAAAGALDTGRVAAEWLAFLPMMSFGEPFLNGALMAVAVIYRPQWVMSFDDRLYLRRPGAGPGP